MRIPVVLITTLLVASLATAHEKPDKNTTLIVNLIVDPEIREKFDRESEFVSYLNELLSRASLIFNAEIGRHFELGSIKIGTRAKDRYKTEEPEFFMSWLRRQDDGRGRFVIFFTNTAFFDRDHARLLGGYSDPNGNRLLLVEYAFETQRVAMVILHHIGHLCGAGHSEDPPSIMSRTRNNSISFKEHKEVIQKNCGKKN